MLEPEHLLLDSVTFTQRLAQAGTYVSSAKDAGSACIGTDSAQASCNSCKVLSDLAHTHTHHLDSRLSKHACDQSQKRSCSLSAVSASA